MISADDARKTVELDNYYIIQPDFKWWNPLKLHKEGKKVSDNFEYDSGTNTEWLNVDEIKALAKDLNA